MAQVQVAEVPGERSAFAPNCLAERGSAVARGTLIALFLCDPAAAQVILAVAHGVVHAGQVLVIVAVVIQRNRRTAYLRDDACGGGNINLTRIFYAACAGQGRGCRKLFENLCGHAVRAGGNHVVTVVRRLHLKRECLALHVACTFISAEEEGLVANHRPAHIGTELIVDLRCPYGGEKIARVHLFIAGIFPQAAMKFIRA